MIVRALGSHGPRVSALGLGCMAGLERAVPAGAAAGTRYDAYQMGILDSERGSSAA